MHACCKAASHPWDRYEVDLRWLPGRLRCLIVGENPGSDDSDYFYTVPRSYSDDTVGVRRRLLCGLHNKNLIQEATLEAFREAGFLFDHAIRCPLPREVVEAERRAARRYASERVKHPAHLEGAIAQASAVWVMGHIASNAVANTCKTFPKTPRLISKPPYPGELSPNSKFFLSRYLTWCDDVEVSRICQAFAQFARKRAIFQSPT